MSLKLMYITNRINVALIAEKYGVNRIWIDLETLGKNERQHNMNTVKSQHSIEDIKKIKPLLTKSEMLVRVNPWNEKSVKEIDEVITVGADIIMLPMWRSVDEVADFLFAVGGRCKTTLLLETKEAVECLDDVLNIGGMDEIHIGLNDLHLSYGMTFMFELLADGTIEKLTRKIKDAGLPYGFGGIAKIGDGLLPAEKIIMEHYRLGSTRAILSRTFCDNAVVQDITKIDQVFNLNMKALRNYEASLETKNAESLFENTLEIQEIVHKIVSINKEKKDASNK